MFLVLFLLINANLILGQNHEKIDSLKKVLFQTENDSLKMELNKSLGIMWEASNLDSSIFHYNQGIKIAKEYEYLSRIAVLEVNKAFAYNVYSQKEEAIQALEKSLHYYQLAEDINGKLLALYNLGTFHLSYGQLSEAVLKLKEAILISKEIEDYVYLTKSLNNISVTYQYMGDYQSSIEYLMEVLQLREDRFSEEVGLSYANLGLAYVNNKNIDKGIEYYTLAIQKFEANDKKQHTINCLYNLADAYFQQNNIELAKNSYNKAFFLSQTEESPTMTGRFYLFESSINLLSNDFEDAINNLEKAIKEFEISGNQPLLVTSYTRLSDANFKWYQATKNTKLLKRALTYSEEALDLAKQSDLLDQVNFISKLLLNISIASNDLSRIKRYSELLIETTDSIYNKDKAKAVLAVQTQYETKKKELEISLLNQENKLQEVELNQSITAQKRQEKYTFISIMALLITFSAIFLIYRLYRQKRISLEELSIKNKQISKEQEKNEILLKEIHHRVKNNLQVISSLLDLQSQNIVDDTALSAVTDGQTRVKSMALIHQNLYQNENIGSISFNDYVTQLNNQIASIYGPNKQIKFTISTESKDLDIDTSIPLGLILNELISNAYKYAFQEKENGEITIDLKEKEDGEFELIVKDNGIGLPNHFDINTAKSLGLKLVRRLCKQLYGSVSYSYVNGAIFKIQFKNTIARNKIQ